jgi:hypothetical protein
MPTKKVKKKPVKAKRFKVLLSDIDATQIEPVYAKLKEKLQVDLKRAGNLTLRRLILDAPEDQRLAGWIYALAKEELGKSQIQFDRKMGGWIQSGRARIAEMKEDGEWSGTVTQDDVTRVVAEAFPAYTEAKEELLRAEKIERAARTLYDVFTSRLSSLQTYSRLLERSRGVSQHEFNKRGEE